ncbi:MAG TPA: nuclear transport factor 2 family protein, partial [Vicingus sp.]|nr:nuclear transport factor 2 family protein [Vicingus sp.]
MKNFLLLFIIILFSNNIKAQNDTLAINQVITQLFDGMRTSDSNLVKNVFHTEATLQTVITNKTDET